MSKRIIIDARRLRSTTGRYARELLNNLQTIDTKNEYFVIIHTKDQGTWAPKTKNFNLRVVDWDHYTFSEQIGLHRYIKSLSPDLVHFTMPQQPIFLDIPTVTTIHDLTLANYKNPNKNPIVYGLKQNVFKFVLKKSAQKSKAVLTDANYTKDEIAQFAQIPKEKIHVAYPSSDAMPKKTKEYKPAKDKEFLLYVGNVFPYKNVAGLVEAHQKLLLENPKLYLFIVGKEDENTKALKNLVQKRSYRQVVFTGFVEDEELAWIYTKAKAYVFPSFSEGFGMPGLEAMQYDLPVVSSNATCLPEIYGEAAHYFDPHNIEAMARAINNVMVDAKLRNRLIDEGRKQVKKYSWNKMSKEIHKVYMSALNK